MGKFNFIFLVSIFLFNCLNSNAYERNFNLKKFPDLIKINLDSKASKSFIVNSTRAFFSTRDITIDFENNSWIKAQLQIDGEIYLGEIKRHGGQKDHLDPPFSSLKVKLKKNYKGIREFILFLKDSRDFEKEIFWTSVIEELGFPSPLSFLSSVEFLGEKKIYLFQEKIGKEFLENFGIGDLPIVEYDERQMWSNIQLKIKNNEKMNWENWTDSLIFFGKIDNARFIKNNNALKIAQKAVNHINYNFQLSENFQIYNELHLTYSKHALYGNNRKFVYNPMYNILTPIYYDGGNWSFDVQNTKCDEKKIFNKTKSVLESFKNKYKSNLKKYLVCTANDIFIKYEDINWKEKRFEHLLNFQSEIYPNKNGLYINLPNNCYGHLIHEYSKCLVEDNLETNLVTVFFQDNENFLLCSFEKKSNLIHNCRVIEDFETIKKIVSGNKDPEKLLTKKFNFKKGYYESIDKKYNLNIGIINSNQIQKNQFEIVDFKNLNINKIILDQNKTYILNLYNRENKKYKFDIIFKNQNSRLIIIGKVNKFDSFQFRGVIDLNSVTTAFRYDENKLTGCVTFLDVHFEGGNIFSDNMFCEDNINIIRGEGKLEYVELSNSKFDALDLDFSKITIDDINILKSGNDCVDISYGFYNFKNIDLDKCGDKGLSVGERSNANIINFHSKNTNIAVASKDSSKVFISNSNIDNTKFCLAAYNKKSEFDGGLININKFECNNFFKSVLQDKISKIILENKINENVLTGDVYNRDEIIIDKKINFIDDLKALNEDGSFNAVIEISQGDKKKYEVSKISGKLELDFMYGSPREIKYKPYPVNYGMIPNTVLPLNRGGDGDPLDVLILGEKINKGEIVNFLPVGIIQMIDEGQRDDKIIGFKIEDKKNINLSENNIFLEKSKKIQEIKSWFENYKGIGIIEVIDFKNANEAMDLITKANKFYKKSGVKKF